MVLIFDIRSAISYFLPPYAIQAEQAGPLSYPKWIIIPGISVLVFTIVGGIDTLGLILSRLVGFPDLWEQSVPNSLRFFRP